MKSLEVETYICNVKLTRKKSEPLIDYMERWGGGCVCVCNCECNCVCLESFILVLNALWYLLKIWGHYCIHISPPMIEGCADKKKWTAYKKREKTKMFTRNDCVDSQLWKYQVKLHHLWWYLGGSRGRMMPKRPESISDLPPTENILWISKCSMYDRGAQELLTHLQFSVSQESTESPLRTVLHDDDPPHW